ncbi:hypothetical protein DFH08DRAFT_895328 [Mycena albidolilacea]|uniref:Uncharacterized protein n=1 Tax=Mycena albidolilacea TaxID=1033008 RepID=A0AAD7ED44_9AGAR|nr:hypothetical protein DFH08DRAFT_895328 [Mycena albidolilacea]
MFCIVASILKAYSSVFSLPQPSESADMGTMEGHPVITLHDRPEDFKVFCRPYLTPGLSNLLKHGVEYSVAGSFFMPPSDRGPVRTYSCNYGSRTQYDVADLRRRALEHLGTIYPTTLAGYDARPG